MAETEYTSITQALDSLAQVSVKIGSIEIHPYSTIKGILVIVFLLWVTSLIMSLTDRRLRRIKAMRASNRVLILKILQILIYCVVFMVGMQMLGINLTALSVFSGALGVGLGFGLQKIASNFISGIILLFEKSIEPGDMIQLADGTIGTIRRTQARYTLLEIPDGRDVLIPNEEFISQRVISWTHSDKYARIEIALTVSYEANVALAQKLMLEIAESHPKRLKLRPCTCTLSTFNERGVELQVQFWIGNIIDGRGEPKSEVMLAILQAFQKNNIAIPSAPRDRAPEIHAPGIASKKEPKA